MPKIIILPIYRFEADAFLKAQAENICGCKLYSSFVDDNDRVPNIVTMTKKESLIVHTRLLRLYEHYSHHKDEHSMTGRSLALSFLAGHQWINNIELMKEYGLLGMKVDEDEIPKDHYPVFR